jgi:dipeptidyl aminopeptidase/acylaminoacyl peptidase
MYRTIPFILFAAMLLAFADSPAAHAQKAEPLSEGAQKKAVTIYCDGIKMQGDLYVPAGFKKDDKRPAVIFCNGTGGTRKGTPTKLATHFVKAGYVFLAFDYRGWGDSDGKLMPLDALPKPGDNGEVTVKARVARWQMNYADQTEDIRAAISYVAGEPGVDPEKIGIMGFSYGGGLVTWVAGNDPRVKCVVAQVPGMGGRGPQAEKAAYALATKQARGEVEPVPFETGKLGGKMASYENMRANPARSIGFNAVEAAAKIKVPALFVVAEKEELSNNAVVEQVQKDIQMRGVPTGYHVIKDITHYGIYREGFAEATKLELKWFDKHLKASPNTPKTEK